MCCVEALGLCIIEILECLWVFTYNKKVLYIVLSFLFKDVVFIF